MPFWDFTLFLLCPACNACLLHVVHQKLDDGKMAANACSTGEMSLVEKCHIRCSARNRRTSPPAVHSSLNALILVGSLSYTYTSSHQACFADSPQSRSRGGSPSTRRVGSKLSRLGARAHSQPLGLSLRPDLDRRISR